MVPANLAVSPTIFEEVKASSVTVRETPPSPIIQTPVVLTINSRTVVARYTVVHHSKRWCKKKPGFTYVIPFVINIFIKMGIA